MKSPKSAFPTWSTYVPTVGPVGTGGSVNYDLRSMYGPRGRGPTFLSSGDLRRSAAISAQQLATAAGTGTQVAAQMAHRPIMTALENNRGRWAMHDWAEDVGDRPNRRYPGQVQAPPNMPGDYGSRVGWPAEPELPKTVRIGKQEVDMESFSPEAQAKIRESLGGHGVSHGNPAAAETAQGVRRAMSDAAEEVVTNPKLVIPTGFTPRKRK